MGKYERDLATYNAITANGTDNLTHAERIALINLYGVSHHDRGGKIEGIDSCDSSCHGCTFCQHMREAAEHDHLIICGLCYDAEQETGYKSATITPRHQLNLRIMANTLFEVDELATLSTRQIIRINSSGDLENVTHARNMIRIAKAKPWARVAIWTKNIPAIESALAEEGKPINLIIVVSSPRINHPIRRPAWADYTFTVYDADHIDAAIAAGAMPCNGTKCKICGYKCYFGLWPAGADIAEILRIPGGKGKKKQPGSKEKKK